jgi:hypothetical protein
VFITETEAVFIFPSSNLSLFSQKKKNLSDPFSFLSLEEIQNPENRVKSKKENI